jgi:hypothetical protein
MLFSCVKIATSAYRKALKQPEYGNCKGKKIATLYFSNDGFCNQEAGLSGTWTDLHAKEGDEIFHMFSP